MDINRATIVGRLTRDPEVRTTPSGVNVVNFGVATNSVWKDRASGEKKEAVEFHNIVAFGKLGEIIAQYMTKGRRVLVEGRIQTRSWEGQDGAKKNRTEIVADNIIMLDSKGSSGGGISERAPSEEKTINIDEPQPSKQTQDMSAAVPDKGTDVEEISVEDIPF